MDNQDIDTRQALINSFKNLLIEIPFEKITIKKITDGANVIRPTFYNYFPDKYAIFEEILDDELFDAVYQLADLKMFDEAVSMLFVYFDKNKDFYHQAFKVTGQNSFENILHSKIEKLSLYALDKFSLKDKETIEVLSDKGIAHYYTIGIIDVIKNWCNYKGDEHKVDDIIKAYKYLVSHSLNDIFDIKEP